ncbi:MAG: S9 family peptidase [Calditrichaeota bacterium]|nr:MAG: S9 family peptidase [Calditrichota bacterium]
MRLNSRNTNLTVRYLRSGVLSIWIFVLSQALIAQNVLTPEAYLNLKNVSGATISPDGNSIAYTVSVPRLAGEKPGYAYRELWIYDLKTKKAKPFITGKVSIRGIAWKPDGSGVSFLSRRDGSRFTQIYLIPLDGGEASPITDFEYSVSSYKWHPGGEKLAYIATEPKSKREQALSKKGFGFIYYEENLRHANLYMFNIKTSEVEQLTEDRTVWSFEFSPNGNTVALASSEKNLIDHRYAFQQIFKLDLATKVLTPIVTESRKFGNYCFSPDGKNLALAAALTKNDHAVSQAFVYSLSDGAEKNLTAPDFRGHVNWVNWKDNNTLFLYAQEGVEATLSTQSIKTGAPKVLLHSEKSGALFNAPSVSRDNKTFAFTASSATFPDELFAWKTGKKLEKLTNSNPQLNGFELGQQEVITYKTSDGWEVEGLLVYPVDYTKGMRYPLVLIIHGGPEARFANGWLTNYSRPAQILAGKGYAVFYPNYRASTGYGVKFAAAGYHDAAGKEFDDIAEGIDYLVEQGIADRERVGLGGGSYGGYASAWFATYYTKYVNAVCMFVGISDLISKRSTTDIPYEELYVHSGEKLEKMWEQSLKRSPIYYAHQSKTATLIYGGTADTRVHPSQSLELYRRMKMNDHPAVRLVRYPGEPHGNRKQPGQIDVLYRILDWYDWYVKDAKALDGPMPPLDISEKYGLSLPE